MVEEFADEFADAFAMIAGGDPMGPGFEFGKGVGDGDSETGSGEEGVVVLGIANSSDAGRFDL